MFQKENINVDFQRRVSQGNGGAEHSREEGHLRFEWKHARQENCQWHGRHYQVRTKVPNQFSRTRLLFKMRKDGVFFLLIFGGANK